MVTSNSRTWPSFIPCFVSSNYLGTLNSSSVDSIFTGSNTAVSGLRKWSDDGDAEQMIGIFSLILATWFLKKLIHRTAHIRVGVQGILIYGENMSM